MDICLKMWTGFILQKKKKAISNIGSRVRHDIFVVWKTEKGNPKAWHLKKKSFLILKISGVM